MITLNNIPGDYIQIREPDGKIYIFRQEFADQLHGLLSNPPRETFAIGTGKGQTRFYDLAGISVAVKEYHHGGILAPLLRDYYMYPPHRAVEEMRLLAIGRQKGVPVLEPLGCAILPVFGPLFRYRLITRQEPGARNLLERLRAKEIGHEKKCATALRLLHDSGIFHRDLNLANFILGDHGVIICDLDRGKLYPTLSAKKRRNNINRLARSVRKQEITDRFSMDQFEKHYDR